LVFEILFTIPQITQTFVTLHPSKGESMDLRTAQLTQFLKEELAVPADSIPQVLEQCKNLNRLPVVLWQKKLVTLAQLDRLFIWLERFSTQVA